MTVVAAGDSVHQIASEPNELPILTAQIQRHWRYLEAAFDPRIIRIAVVPLGSDYRRVEEDACQSDSSKSSDSQNGSDRIF
jgi:hypothetical protein